MGKSIINGVNQTNGTGGRQDLPHSNSLINRNSMPVQIDTGPIHQQPVTDTGPLTTQDSLSLGQLKKLVSEGVKVKAPEYAFTYTDTDVLPNELNDFFSYDRSEMDLIFEAKEQFGTLWEEFCTGPGNLKGKSRTRTGGNVTRWRDTEPELRQKFVARYVDSLETIDQGKRVRALEVLSYIAQGVFGEAISEHDQLYWVVENSKLLRKCAAVDTVYQVFRGIMSKTWDNIYLPEPSPEKKLLDIKELRHSILILYFIFTVYIPPALMDRASHRKPPLPSSIFTGSSYRRPPLYNAPTVADCDSLRDETADLDPLFIPWLIKTISQIRWQDEEKQKDQIPLQQLLLLTWKGILVGIGSIKNPKHLAKTKSYARVKEGLSKRVDKKMITASPLDYHNFRQDILAKYPAYNPPPSVNGFEIDRLKRSNSSSTNLGGLGGGMLGGPYDGLSGNHCTAGANGILGGTTSSILNQPVHIATPAPSPPPSPAGGKGAKKQNYQTNQNFPFLYPPPNSSASDVWGKVAVGQMDTTSVPESILEAGDLFQRRIRMTLAMRQLWKEREEFLRHERGWAGGLGLGDEPKGGHKDEYDYQEAKPETAICMEERRLRTVEDVYANCLPNLQSFIIVCLKVVLQNLCTPPPAPHPQSDDQHGDGEINTTNGIARDDVKLNMMRETEIMSKAVSAIFLLLLKWFRVSHILKFEYVTQLLLDTSYLPIMLRIFAHVEVGAHVNTKTDRTEFSYLYLCKLHSAAPEPDNNIGSPSPTDIDEDSEISHREEEEIDADEAVPPPIRMRRDTLPPPIPPPTKPPPPLPLASLAPGPSNSASSTVEDAQGTEEEAEIKRDESPQIITDYSWRNFFTVVNYLRIMQKICKGKAHRNLLLVQYKSSPSLRKALKCSQDEMRLYTLKLFKGQVPYCGRKWRQGNMKVITGIYLHCRPELRDDWLAGADVDAEVEDALPQEQAIRALTHFYNIQRYPLSMGADEDMLSEERDFFGRELERMQVLGIGGIGGQGVGDFLGEGSGGQGVGSNGNIQGTGDREVDGSVGGSWDLLGDQWSEMPPI